MVFELVTRDDGYYASFRSAEVEITRFRPGWKWEFYTIIQKGESRGLPMFVRYLTDEEGARVTAALDTELAKRRLFGKGAA